MTKRNGQTATLNPDQDLFSPVCQYAPIEWPSEHQLREVATRLAAIRQRGADFEAAGDYFNSGDLAYQLRGIIDTTAALFSKSQRAKR